MLPILRCDLRYNSIDKEKALKKGTLKKKVSNYETKHIRHVKRNRFKDYFTIQSFCDNIPKMEGE